MGDESGGAPVKDAGAVQDAGLLAFLENLRGAGEELEAVARKYKGLAAAAAESQPAHPAIAEGLMAVATMATSAAGVAGELHPTARRQHDGDYARAEEPRRGDPNLEAKADVAAGQRDGVI